MSKLLNVTKKISAIAVSALMLSSASFANLSNYSSHFEKSGKFVGEVVVGSGIGADDAEAANIVISDLKDRYSGESMVELSFSRSGKVSNEGSSFDLSDDNDVYLGLTLGEIENKLDYDETGVSFLRDGILSDQENENKDYDYEQIIELSDAQISFGRSVGDLDDRVSTPVPYLDMDGKVLYTLTVDFQDTVDYVSKDSSDEGKGLVDGEKLEIFGQEFTFDPNTEDGDDLKLFTSSQTVVLDSDGSSSVTVNHEGRSYEVVLLGANSASNKVEVAINGDRESVDEGDTATIGGLKVFVDEVFVDDLVEAEKDASARLFLGSNEIEIPTSARGGDFKKLIIDGDNVRGYEVKAETSGSSTWDGLKELQFQVTPSEWDGEFDEIEYLMDEDYVQDPLFKELSVSFASPNDLKQGDEVQLKAGSEDATLEFVNEDGNDYKLEVYTGDENSAAVSLYADEGYEYYSNYTDDLDDLSDGLGKNEVLVLSETIFGEDNIFILNEDSSGSSDEWVTQIYQVDGFGYEGSSEYDHYVTITNLMTGDSEDYEVGDELDDTKVTIKELRVDENTLADDDVEATYFELDFENVDDKELSDADIYTDGNLKLSINGDGTIDVAEVPVSGRDATLAEDMVITVDSEASNSDTEVEFTESDLAETDDDADGEWEYGLTKVGTYSEEDTDDNEEVTLWTPEEEIEYSVSFNFGEVSSSMEGSRVVKASEADEIYAELQEEGYSVSRSNLKTSNIEFRVSAPVSDSEATGRNMIVVGGPAVNSQARALLGGNEGLSEGQAVVRYFSDKNSVLVYGWSKQGTMAAAKRLVSGSAIDNQKFNE